MNFMPAIFIGHGNPMNALANNTWTQSWSAIGNSVPRPKAVLVISAHWYLPATFVTAMDAPRTIYDFGGFSKELYDVKYPAPGSLVLAKRVQSLLAPIFVGLDHQWGLDHGTSSVLCHILPQADVPVVQLSLDWTKSNSYHYELGKRLLPLREDGVLIIGSGNIVHNLPAYFSGQDATKALDWAVRFEERVKPMLLAGDHEALINYQSLDRDAMLSVPTPEHYLPLLYILGLCKQGDEISFPVAGFDGASISMLAVKIG